MLALIGENLEVAAAVVVFAVWKGPTWGLDVLALEKAWEERRKRNPKPRNKHRVECPRLRRYPDDMAHATKANKSVVQRRRAAAERTRGMFAHVAPGVSMADELIADRRAEVRAEEHADAERQSDEG